jgi:hypothetical protein
MLEIRGGLTPLANCSGDRVRRTNLNLLNPDAEQLGECLLILLCDFNTQRSTAHGYSMGQNNST